MGTCVGFLTRLPGNWETGSFSLFFFVLFCCFYVRSMRVCSPSRFLADIYGRVLGVCRITFHRRGPGERRCFLSATWLSVVCSAQPRLPVSPPTSRPKPPPKLQRSPYCWQLSLPPRPRPLLPSLNPPLPDARLPALPLLDADTASTAGVL